MVANRSAQTIRRVHGRTGDPYTVIFLDPQGRPIVPLTEWYRLRTGPGPNRTRDTYLAGLLTVFSFFIDRDVHWNDPPDRIRDALIAFHRDRLACRIRPARSMDGIDVVSTRDTPLSESTMRVLRAALRDFYAAMREAGLYAHPNPLTSEVLLRLKQVQEQAVDNRGAPDHAGIRGEPRARSRRRPTAFIHQARAEEWTPDGRTDTAAVRAGMHAALDAMIEGRGIGLRERAVLLLLRYTGARVHEIAGLSVGGYRRDGMAGRARVVNKGSYGREVKTIDFSAAPVVQRALTRYLREERPRHDPHGRTRLADVADDEPFFLTDRGTPYTPRTFYWHWYRLYPRARRHCPVPFAPHDIRHLFITEYLLLARRHFGHDEAAYRDAKEAFGRYMGWRSLRTIEVYDHSSDREQTLLLVSELQRRIAQDASPMTDDVSARAKDAIVWANDDATRSWVAGLQS